MFETRNVPGATKLVYHRVQPESDDTSNDSFIDQYAPIHAEMTRREPYPGYFMIWSISKSYVAEGGDNGTYTYQRNVYHNRTFTTAYNSSTRKTGIYYRSNAGYVQNIHPSRSMKVNCTIQWNSGTDDTFKVRVMGTNKNLATGQTTDLGAVLDDPSRKHYAHSGTYGGPGHGTTSPSLPKYDLQELITPNKFKNYDATLGVTIPPNTEMMLQFQGGVWGGSSADRVGLGYAKFDSFTMV